MTEIFSRLDMLAPKYELSFKGDNGYKTPVGSVLTLFVFGLTFFSIRNILSDFIFKTNPQMTMQNFVVDEFTNISASNINMKISFEIVGNNRTTIDTTGIFAPKVEYTHVVDNHTENLEERMGNCQTNQGTSDPKSFCLDTNQMINFGKTEFEFDPEESVDYANQDFVMRIQYDELLYNISNYTSPIFMGSNTEFVFTKSFMVSQRELTFVKKTIDIQDTGFILYNKRDQLEFYVLDQVKLIYSFDESFGKTGHHFRFTIKTTGESIQISYVTFDDLLSAFGGTLTTILFIVQTTYSYFSEYFMNIELINAVFNFHSVDLTISNIIDNKLKCKFENIKYDVELTNMPINKTSLIKSGSKQSAESDIYLERRKLFEYEFDEYHCKKRLMESKYMATDQSQIYKESEIQLPDKEANIDLKEQLESFVEIADNIKQARSVHTYGCFQYFKAKCKRSLNINKLNVEEKILLSADTIIGCKMSYEFLAKSLIDLSNMKSYLFHDSLKNLMSFPSLNVHSPYVQNSLEAFIDDISKNTIDSYSSKYLIADLFSNSESWKDDKIKRLFENFTKSLF